jgi:pimeloyl-ACP methyl ester carboxylesterase
MFLNVKQMTAAGTALLRKAIPARGWRRYAAGAVATVAAFGTVVGVTALPAQAAHAPSAHTASARDGFCAPPPSPRLAGFRQGFVSVAGDSAVHYVTGGTGPVLVLLHGWPTTWWEFSQVMPALAQNYTVIAFDIPGLGNSAPSTAGYTDAAIATELHDAVAALGYGTQPVSILGHDVGGNLTYAYARLFPASVSRVMILETALNGYGLESLYGLTFHFTFNQSPPSVTEGMVNNIASSDAYLVHMYSFVASPGAGAITPLDQLIWDADYACPNVREQGYDYYRAYPDDATWDTTTNTSKLTVEMGAMGGDNSFGGFVAQSLGNVDSNVKTIIAPNSGHYIPDENPGFLSECATLYFSPDPPATAPAGFASCLP